MHLRSVVLLGSEWKEGGGVPASALALEDQDLAFLHFEGEILGSDTQLEGGTCVEDRRARAVVTPKREVADF
jgi:hypothetical protein